MRIFEEKQKFRQWWLYLIAGSLVIGILAGFFFRQDVHPGILLLILLSVVIPFAFIFSLKLYTRIDGSGITAQFLPLGFTRKYFKWKEIRECQLRKYSPMREYGGWGIRKNVSGKKAYNVKGNTGIQIVTKDNKSFLIGTQKPEEAKQVIKYYKNKKEDI